MAARRAKFKRERDLHDVARLYLAGKFQSEIADVIGVNRSTVSRDLKTLQERWRASATTDFDAARAEQLAKIDQLERTYWEAWERSLSKEITEKEKKLGAGEGTRVSVRTETRDGVHFYLDGVFKCIERRCKILGLDAPVKQDVNLHDFTGWSDDDLEAEIVREAEQITGRAAEAKEGSQGSAGAE